MIILYLNPDMAVHGFVRGRNRDKRSNIQQTNRDKDKLPEMQQERDTVERARERALQYSQSEGRGGQKAKTVTPSWPTSPCTASSAAADATRTAAANAAALAPAHCCYISKTPGKCKISCVYVVHFTAEKILARRNMIP